MMKKWQVVLRYSILLAVFGGLLFLQACSRQAWFEGMKARERQECDKLINDRDIQQCLERVHDTKIE